MDQKFGEQIQKEMGLPDTVEPVPKSQEDQMVELMPSVQEVLTAELKALRDEMKHIRKALEEQNKLIARILRSH